MCGGRGGGGQSSWYFYQFWYLNGFLTSIFKDWKVSLFLFIIQSTRLQCIEVEDKINPWYCHISRGFGHRYSHNFGGSPCINKNTDLLNCPQTYCTFMYTCPEGIHETKLWYQLLLLWSGNRIFLFRKTYLGMIWVSNIYDLKIIHYSLLTKHSNMSLFTK